MKRLVIESWFLLLYFDCIMHLSDFKRLHRIVREQKVNPGPKTERTCEQLCHAVDWACVFYFRRALCLQRSAAATVLLRRHGWRAQMVLGVQMLPLLSHAWVEVEGRIVNDKPYMSEIFQVLERC
jgi:Transglutaminase-like superfamily